MDQAAPADQAVLWDLRERGEDANMDRRVGLRAGGHHQEAARAGRLTLHINASPFGDNIRKMSIRTALSLEMSLYDTGTENNQLELFSF